jgi:hypothetical protein
VNCDACGQAVHEEPVTRQAMDVVTYRGPELTSYFVDLQGLRFCSYECIDEYGRAHRPWQ